MSKSQKVLHLLEATTALAVREPRSIRTTGGNDLGFWGYLKSRRAVGKEARAQLKSTKAKISRQMKSLKRQRKQEVGSIRGKRRQAMDLLRDQYKQAKLASARGEHPKGKFYKADLDKMIKKSQYKLFGAPKSPRGLLTPGNYDRDFYPDDFIDVEWTNVDGSPTGKERMLSLPAHTARGRGRPLGSGKNPPRVRVKPQGSGPGRPRTNPIGYTSSIHRPISLNNPSINVGDRTIALPPRRPIAGLLTAGRRRLNK